MTPKPKRSRPGRHLAAATGLVFITNGVVLFANLYMGVYRTDADSIGIPVFECFVTCLLVLAFGQVGLKLRKRPLWRLVVSAFFTGVALLLCLASIWQWAIPNHYPIAIAYAVLAIATLAPRLPRPVPSQ